MTSNCNTPFLPAYNKQAKLLKTAQIYNSLPIIKRNRVLLLQFVTDLFQFLKPSYFPNRAETLSTTSAELLSGLITKSGFVLTNLNSLLKRCSPPPVILSIIVC